MTREIDFLSTISNLDTKLKKSSIKLNVYTQHKYERSQIYYTQCVLYYLKKETVTVYVYI